jgi:hypothetical protein
MHSGLESKPLHLDAKSLLQGDHKKWAKFWLGIVFLKRTKDLLLIKYVLTFKIFI